MTIFQAIILAFVEAVTEFLPVSSTAHLILAGKLMGLESTAFLRSFEIIIQLGAIAAVVILFAGEIWKNKKLWPKIVWAFVPTMILGVVAYPIIKDYLLKGQLITGIMLILGGIIFIVWEKYWFKDEDERKEITEISNQSAVKIGLWQAIAFIPGVSRSAVTVLGGMMGGLKRGEAVRFAFMLAIPTMAAATGMDLLKTFLKGEQGSLIFTNQEWTALVVGLIVTFFVSLLIIKWLVKFMSKKGSFVWFGWYRIAIGLWWLFLFA